MESVQQSEDHKIGTFSHLSYSVVKRLFAKRKFHQFIFFCLSGAGQQRSPDLPLSSNHLQLIQENTEVFPGKLRDIQCVCRGGTCPKHFTHEVSSRCLISRATSSGSFQCGRIVSQISSIWLTSSPHL